jgi:hypothetical protein
LTLVYFPLSFLIFFLRVTLNHELGNYNNKKLTLLMTYHEKKNLVFPYFESSSHVQWHAVIIFGEMVRKNKLIIIKYYKTTLKNDIKSKT